MEQNYIMNGRGYGGLAGRLMANDCYPGAMRPYIGKDGRHYITTLGLNGKPEPCLVNNANATLRKDEWLLLDQQILKVARPRLRLWNDLNAASPYNIPNGMGVMAIQHQTQSDVSDAIISMDALRRSDRDRPHYDLTNIPCPIISKDFSFGLRELMASRRGGSPLDTSMAELCGRKVADAVENLVLGTTTITHSAGTAYGNGTVQGYTSYSNRLTYTLTSPATAGWIPADLVDQVLAMILTLTQHYYFGPFMMYNSTSWDRFMDNDYSAAKGDLTLRDRLKKISQITDVRTADFLTNYDLVLVQMTSDVAQAVTGMGITTIQWETEGGMEVHFKVMCIMFPRIRCDNNNNTGLLHASA